MKTIKNKKQKYARQQQKINTRNKHTKYVATGINTAKKIREIPLINNDHREAINTHGNKTNAKSAESAEPTNMALKRERLLIPAM